MTIPMVWVGTPCVPISETEYPDGDVSTGSWSPTPIYGHIDDTSDGVSTPGDVGVSDTYTFECTIADPSSTPGRAECQSLQVVVRLHKVLGSSGLLSVAVTLKEGSSTTIATGGSLDVGILYTYVGFTLSAAEYRSISDHDNLRIRVAATVSPDTGSDYVTCECLQVRLVYS